MKNEKGITLIALVIMVIIMLILAGVAISALTGDGGLFDKTLKSAETYENAAQKEAKQLDDLMNEIDGYIGDLTADKKAPSVAKLEVSNITDTGFTLTATGKDDKGIVKYEFYIKDADGNFKLERTMEVSGNTAVYNVTGKTPNQSSYEYKVIVYDAAGNSKESDVITVGGKKASEVVQIGDYINYDAGVWTQEDFDKITSSEGNPTVVNNKLTANGQFGGIELEKSKNTKNITVNETSKLEGWRVWSIDSSSGVVMLISANCPEAYYFEGDSTAGVKMLKNRNCTMYVNKYATEAHIITGTEAVAWYNEMFGTSYTLVENGGNTTSTFAKIKFTTAEPISVLKSDTPYWFAMAYNSACLYRTSLIANGVCSLGGNGGTSLGIRILVSLKSDVLVGSGDGSVDNPWKLAQ